MYKLPSFLSILCVFFFTLSCEKEILEPKQLPINAKTDSTVYSIEEIDAIFEDKHYQID